MSDLLISKNNKLVRQDIITQNQPYGDVSNRYKPIVTNDVLDIIREVRPDMEIVGFNNANVRIKDKDTKQRHVLMLEFNDAEMIDGTKMNLVLFNSLDRSMSMRLIAGSIRMACSNNIVWADSIMEELRIKHTRQDWQHSVQSLMENFEETQRKTQETINAMMDRYMSYGDSGRFAERVAEEIINPSISGTLLDPKEMLIAQRKEDIGKNLWKNFNIIQEYLSTGNLHRIIEKTDDSDPKHPRLIETISKTHKITDETKRIKLNKQLSEMAMEYL